MIMSYDIHIDSNYLLQRKARTKLKEARSYAWLPMTSTGILSYQTDASIIQYTLYIEHFSDCEHGIPLT